MDSIFDLCSQVNYHCFRVKADNWSSDETPYAIINRLETGPTGTRYAYGITVYRNRVLVGKINNAGCYKWYIVQLENGIIDTSDYLIKGE